MNDGTIVEGPTPPPTESLGGTESPSVASQTMAEKIKVAEGEGYPPRKILEIIAEGSQPASPEFPQDTGESPITEGGFPSEEPVVSDLTAGEEEISPDQPQNEAPNQSTQPEEKGGDEAQDADDNAESGAQPEGESSGEESPEESSETDQLSEEESGTSPDNPAEEELGKEEPEIDGEPKNPKNPEEVSGEERNESDKEKPEEDSGSKNDGESSSKKESMTEEEALQGIIDNLGQMTIHEIQEAAIKANLSPESQRKLLNALEERIASSDLDEEEAEEQSSIKASIKEEAKRIIEESPLSKEAKKKQEEEVMAQLEQQEAYEQSKKRRALQIAWIALKIGFEIANHIKQQELEEAQANRNAGQNRGGHEENELVSFFTITNNMRGNSRSYDYYYSLGF